MTERVVHIPAGTRQTIVETAGAQDCLYVVEPKAYLNHIRAVAADTGRTRIQVQTGGRYALDYALVDADTAAQDVVVELQGGESSAQIHGVQLGGGAHKMGTHVRIEHQSAGASSRQFVRNIVDGKSEMRFEGKIVVAPHAQKTDGYQLCNTILLSDGARIFTKPELEIYADDVKCSHGNTVGRLDDMALFYAMQRGLPPMLARRLLLDSFVAEVFDNDDARTHLLPTIEQWMDTHVA